MFAILPFLAAPSSIPAAITPAQSAAFTVTPRATSAGGFSIVVDNRSHYRICYVYISSSDSDTWGADWLGSDIIASNDSAEKNQKT